VNPGLKDGRWGGDERTEERGSEIGDVNPVEE
jgi:hypothetical protein